MPRRGIDRAFRLLLALFPPGFRRERGAEMERLYRDMHAERSRRRGRAGSRFWLSLTLDATRGALAEWSATGRSTIRSTIREREPMSVVTTDLRFAIRQMLRQPTHTLLIVLLMAVGIGGNAAVFRIFNGLFLRPLPFEDAEQLVDLDETAPQWNLEYVRISIADFRDWSRENETFQGMAAYTVRGANLVGDAGAERVSYLAATHEIDDVLAIDAARGRFFTQAEDQPDAPRVALLSSSFWERSYGADPSVIGSTVSLDGLPVEVIGILTPEARFVADADLWVPLREDDSSSYYLTGIGRLRPGVTLEQARADLGSIHAARAEVREENEVTSPTVQPVRERYLGEYRLGGGFLLGAVAVVLLIACGNIAGLMFARSIARRDEMAVRTAMGAGRSRLVRQLLTESAALALLGALVGTTAGLWASERLVSVVAEQTPPWVDFALDVRVVFFTVAATATAALLFGLFPALRASRVDAAGLGGTRSTSSLGSRRIMSGLVVGEVALAVALLIVSGLTVTDLTRLMRVDPGYRTEGVVTYRVQLPEERYPDRSDRIAFAEHYLERLQAIPGVEEAALASTLPLSGHSGWFFEVEGSDVPAMENAVVLRRWVTPGYFEALDVGLLRGRLFDDFDGRDEESFVIVVNEAFVRTHIPEGTDPIGQRIKTGGDDAPWYTIIGVTPEVRHYGLDRDMRPGTYEPIRQNPLELVQVALTTSGPVGPVTSAARTATAEVDPELPLYSVRTIRELLDETLFARRASTWLIGAFSAVALLLAMAGIYGMISYSVGQRSREISIRMAMGAETVRVMGGVVRQGMALAAGGVLAGLALAWAGAGIVSGILVDVSSTTPSVYLAVTGLVLGVAGLANYLPARRAARMDPMATLRGE
jgi:predicted permease